MSTKRLTPHLQSVSNLTTIPDQADISECIQIVQQIQNMVLCLTDNLTCLCI